MRRAMDTVLTTLNFKVVSAANGSEALDRVEEIGTELHAVITDLHMPEMDGLTLSRILRERLPEVSIIVASGRIEEEVAEPPSTFTGEPI